MVQLFAAQSAALVQSDVELVACRTCAIDIQTSGIADITGRVNYPFECAVEHYHRLNEIV